jgi:sporulation protein YlmC with PRC-barrel domain
MAQQLYETFKSTLTQQYSLIKLFTMTTLTQDNFTGVNHEGPAVNTPVRYLTASSVIGDKVYDQNDEHIGTIKDVMLDIRTGLIDYYVVQIGGFLGVGIRYLAVPSLSMKVDPDRKVFIFEHTKKILENAPGFNLNHWPDTNLHMQEEYWSFV